jgi:hypothetical protein
MISSAPYERHIPDDVAPTGLAYAMRIAATKISPLTGLRSRPSRPIYHHCWQEAFGFAAQATR